MSDGWREILEELEERRRQLVDEIVHYPPPIPRCDVQYNTLLEERASVTQELYRAEQLAQTTTDGSEPLAEFVQRSLYLSAATKQSLGTAAGDRSGIID